MPIATQPYSYITNPVTEVQGASLTNPLSSKYWAFNALSTIAELPLSWCSIKLCVIGVCGWK